MEVHKSAYQSNSRNNNDEDPDVIPPYTCMLSELRMAEVPEAQILQEINSMLLAVRYHFSKTFLPIFTWENEYY